MRRVLAVALSVIALVAMLAPPALAQAAAPKVTITGLVDWIVGYHNNVSTVDANLEKSDSETYQRTRFRPDIIAEVGTSKMVLGWEIDHAFGAVGPGGGDTAPAQRFGTSGSFDVNTDVIPHLELKWAYLEFNTPGVPFTWRWRVGAQAFSTTYKSGIIASGDFGGINWDLDIAPPVKLHATYVQIEEESTGRRDGFPNGEDYAVILSVELTPFKGFDIRPIFAHVYLEGTTSGSTRVNRGGVSAAAAGATGSQERRWYVGVDSRLRMGPFSLDPTVMYYTGTREIVGLGVATGIPQEQDMSGLLVDVAAGFQAGPLLLEARGAWVPGNRARQDVRRPNTDVKFYQVIDTDSGYFGTWAEHFSLNIDYFSSLRQGSGGNDVQGCTCNAIGYDKYGLRRISARASYAVTPAFSPRIAVTSVWTDEKVDTDGTYAAATGITPSGAKRRGDHSWLGAEIDLGFQYRFAPGIAWDVVGAYTFVGPAQAHALATAGATPAGGNGGAMSANNVHNVQSVVSRIRFTF